MNKAGRATVVDINKCLAQVNLPTFLDTTRAQRLCWHLIYQAIYQLTSEGYRIRIRLDPDPRDCLELHYTDGDGGGA